MTQTVVLNGVTIGNCDETFVLSEPGIGGLGIPEAKILTELDRVGHHGYVSPKDYLGSRNITVPVTIFNRDDPTTSTQQLRTLKTAWQPTGPTNDVLSITYPGFGPSDDIVRFYGRPRTGVEADLSLLHTGLIIALCSFVALDPIGYGPEDASALSVGSNVINNPGDASTDRVSFDLVSTGGGAVVLTNQTNGNRHITFQSSFNDTYTVDLRTRTVIDSAGNDQFSKLAPTSTWFDLAPGNNTVTITNITSGTVTLRGGWW